jgi:hypothetical protein
LAHKGSDKIGRGGETLGNSNEEIKKTIWNSNLSIPIERYKMLILILLYYFC